MAETADSTVIATELVSKPQKIAAPRYRYMKIYPTTGSGDITITPSDRPNVQFEIPTQAFNYSQSFLCGKLSLPDPSGGAGFNHWLYRDCAAFVDRITFKTRNGATLIDMDYVNNYSKIVNRYEASLEDVMSSDGTDILTSAKPSYSYDYKLEDLKEGSIDVKSVPTQFSDASTHKFRPDGKLVDHPFVEAGYCSPGPIMAGAGTGKVHWDFRIPLSKIVPNSVWSRRSDLKLPEIAIVSLRFAPGTKISWEAKSLSDPVTNAAECNVNTTISGFYLHMARQDDPVYEAMIDERMRAGYVIPMNFPIHSQWLTPGAGSQSQNVAVTYNSGHGNRLVKIYHAVFASAEKKNTAYDNINGIVTYDADHKNITADSRKVKSYHVKLGGLRTTDEDLSTSHIDPSAYLYHRQLLEGTSITNKEVYHANFAHVEDVARIGGPKRWQELSFRKDDALVGVPLTQDFKFEFIATTSNAVYQHYTFAIVQRDLKVNAITALVE